MTMTQMLIIANAPLTDDRVITLRWSDSGGQSWNEGIEKSLGQVGQYNTTPTWYRLGMARNRVIELSWTSAVPTALIGAFVEVVVAAT